MSTLMFIIMTVITVAICALMLLIFIWVLESPCGIQYIGFHNFKSIYTINPDRWKLESGYVGFIKGHTGGWLTIDITTAFKFNLIDYCRYNHWKRTLKKQKRKEKEYKELQEVISIVKSDLKKFEQQNTERMNNEAEDILNTAKNIRGDILFK